jgi:hypothetical protein
MNRFTEPAVTGTALWEHESADGTLLAKFLVTFTRDAFDPGYVSGPPDLCYPPEGGEILVTGLELIGLHEAFADGGTLDVLARLSAEQQLTVARRYLDLAHKDPAIGRACYEACERAYQDSPDRFRDDGPEDEGD